MTSKVYRELHVEKELDSINITERAGVRIYPYDLGESLEHGL